MSWNQNTARHRIQSAMSKAPAIQVKNYERDYLPIYEKRIKLLNEQKLKTSPPLFQLSEDEAVLVDTLQIYIRIINYDEYRLSEGIETEASHQQALQFLHLYYTACDRVAEKTAPQRIDFHGARMHAAIIVDQNQSSPQQVSAEALKFIQEFQAVAIEANKALANDAFTAQFRFGIDYGRCVAINNGSGSEQEPLFLGTAANHSAKLVEGNSPGVYVSDTVRRSLDLQKLGNKVFDHSVDVNTVEQIISSNNLNILTAEAVKSVIDNWQFDISQGVTKDPTLPNFIFNSKQHPLSQIDFKEVTPSNSIRMNLAISHADIDGYTSYIDHSIKYNNVPDAVKALYVIRTELESVVEEDFGGKKIRFIGDCIQSIHAKTNGYSTANRESISDVAKCAGALHSSFELCKQELRTIDDLALAIGVEFGPTPVSKIGIQGERAVRVASSVSTTEAERLQSTCGKNQTRFGTNAMQNMGEDVSQLFQPNGFANDLTFDNVAVALSEVEASTPSFVYATPKMPEPQRAHFTDES